jgi:hypothetical protein
MEPLEGFSIVNVTVSPGAYIALSVDMLIWAIELSEGSTKPVYPRSF